MKKGVVQSFNNDVHLLFIQPITQTYNLSKETRPSKKKKVRLSIYMIEIDRVDELFEKTCSKVRQQYTVYLVSLHNACARSFWNSKKFCGRKQRKKSGRKANGCFSNFVFCPIFSYFDNLSRNFKNKNSEKDFT